jgi:hypothetical protein
MKLARLGTLNPDRYHFNSAGDALKCCAVISGLINLEAPFMSTISDQIIDGWNDIDTILGNTK